MRSIFCFLIVLVAIWSWIAIASCAYARTWTVRADGLGDALTIQSAIDSAATGDTVAVHPGTYNENLTQNDKNLTIKSLSGPEMTILDGGYQARVLTWTGAGTLEGFTIRHGSAGTTLPGGGVYLAGVGPATIRQNIFENNEAGLGGGLYLDVQAVGDILIEANVVRGNIVTSSGGGMLIANAGSDPSRLLVQHNRIEANSSEDSGGGLWSKNTNVTNNVIINNFAVITGGGAVCADFGVFAQNTVAYNNTINMSLNGAGVTVTGSVSVNNNLVVGNHGSPITPVGAGIHCVSDVPRCNLVWDNDIDLDWCATDVSNISQDPEFCAADPASSGVFGIQSDSPCAPGQGSCGLIGAIPVTCGTTNVELKAWSQVKLLYR